MSMTSADIRDAFLNFFKDKGHQIVPSSSLIPANDPTLLFTNAGMVQFKDVFLGSDKRPYSRATSSQRCVRAGGKHNDLENVGYTARHHTFFEMLGNFSFGDYFKEGAIQYAWEFLTEVVKLPKEKLWVTVYETDDEAYDIWAKDIGVPTDRIIRIGDNKGAPYASDNFWSMGDTGPCGPCTEIFYDHGEHIWGGPPGTPEEDGDRYIEIWNIVFMQFNRHSDGRMDPLPKPSVDTGMGLERISAILQHVHSNYEIDLFQHLIKAAAGIIGTTDLENKSLRVIADHIRSCSFLVTDGVMPSNEGRGYVLRRIVRRAVRHGAQLGASEPFFYKLVAALGEVMGDAYPELKEKQAIIEKALLMEEEQFRKTLERGLKLLDEALAEIDGTVIPGDVVFKLYDTYGFPVDLTNDVARERGLTLDEAGFETAMEAQRQRAKQASNFGADYGSRLSLDCETQFSGYDGVRDVSPVVALIKEGEQVQSAQAGDQVLVVLERTPFYGESGGQVGDTGELSSDGVRIAISNTTKNANAFLHHGKVLEGSVSLGDKLKAEVDKARRDAIRLNHSATHLAHAALRKVLGEHVTQKGSLVDPERLRFDFAHFEGVKDAEIVEIERLVNNEIRANHAVTTRLMQIDEAKAAGAMALFGEKYDDEVRVVQMGDFSTELCGGTHVSRTGDIGLFKVVSEAGIAAGVRRIEAVTGEGALSWLQGREHMVGSLAASLKTDVAGLPERFAQQLDRTKQLEKELEKAKAQLAAQAGAALAEQAEELGGIKLLVAELPGADPKSLRELVDKLKDKLSGESVVVLGVPGDDKVSLIAGVSKGLTAKVKAGELIGMVAAQVGGKGGGRPDMAQAGGSDVAALKGALASVKDWVQARL
ncbi:MAG: alanine--tRNA ligase [Pseudomonadota bacterium]|uniref:alanine--tRNA ligase n=1 Tax=Gallaecimonas pentaromativorans TaxID=584787 RepID=UPI00067EF07D|nr:alanine--tRNA ligase [Gallaecimonas pentaromativorans]MED5526388.1 alanine--tRNA ligase [Pseudomonadota bacterium]